MGARIAAFVMRRSNGMRDIHCASVDGLIGLNEIDHAGLGGGRLIEQAAI